MIKLLSRKSSSLRVATTTEAYTLSLHDALPIYARQRPSRPAHHSPRPAAAVRHAAGRVGREAADRDGERSEEHTSELQSRPHLVCRLLLEKKNKSLKHD